MTRRLASLALLAATAAPANSGGLYQIDGALDSGGGPASSPSYALQQTLPSLPSSASSPAYSLLLGFTSLLDPASSGAGPAAFAAWQTAYFGGPLEPEAGPYADPDHDLVPNLLEFAFNLPPFLPSSPLAVPGASGGLPWFHEETIDGARYLMVDFIRRKNAGRFFPESSPQLATWTPATYTVHSGPIPAAPAYERLQLRLGLPLQPGPPAFHRLAVIIQ